MSLSRLRTDFQFAIVTAFGAVAVLGILPFAVYRFAHGQALAGVVDLAIMACILAGVGYVWRGGDMARGALAVTVTSTAGCLVIATLLGMPGVLWMYPVLVANFMLVSRGRALVISALAVAYLIAHGQIFDSRLHEVMFLVSAAVVSLFAWAFAHRTARQRAQLEALAARDPLTGAFNRRAMEQDLALAIESRHRHGTACGLALLDLDYFKQVNDSHGHEAGDEVLVAFTALVQQTLRTLDRIYRIGGEEFVLLLPGVDGPGLATICEAVRARVAARLNDHGDPVTVSIGAALLAASDSPASWLGRADSALYRAKGEGRNRVLLAPAVAAGTGVASSAGVEPGEGSLHRH